MDAEAEDAFFAQLEVEFKHLKDGLPAEPEETLPFRTRAKDAIIVTGLMFGLVVFTYVLGSLINYALNR